MEKIQLLTPVDEYEESKDSSVKIELDKGALDFSKLGEIKLGTPPVEEPTTTPAAKRTRKASATGINKAKSKDEDDDALTHYTNQYVETNGMIKGALAQIDHSLAEMETDVRMIRNSKTLKRKYDYLSMMQGNMGSFLSTKIQAVRELNNSIKACNDFELKRMKELKLSQDSESDDKKMMDLYNAFISMPTSSGAMGPALTDITTGSVSGINTVENGGDFGYQNYLSNMSPAQVLMQYENDPDVEQVVMYDPKTNSRWFEIMNLRTNEVIQGADKHGDIIMEDVTLDLNNGIAKNLNLGESYKIITVGQSVADVY